MTQFRCLKPIRVSEANMILALLVPASLRDDVTAFDFFRFGLQGARSRYILQTANISRRAGIVRTLSLQFTLVMHINESDHKYPARILFRSEPRKDTPEHHHNKKSEVQTRNVPERLAIYIVFK